MAQVSLDQWLCHTALSWGWEQERYLKDGAFELELARLRRALFGDAVPLPEDAVKWGDEDHQEHEQPPSSSGGSLSAAEAELDALLEAQDWDDPVLSDQVGR